MNTTVGPRYFTTAIPFVNSAPHLGFALELAIADALARHARARGTAVELVTGTDDHSLKNVLAAERAGLATADYVAQQSQAFARLCTALDVSADRFVATSRSPTHAPAVRALWLACAARGDLYRRVYRGAYCVGCERFAEPDETRCPEHDAALEVIEENNWFFRASRYQDVLRARIASGQLAITGGAREEALAFLRAPLRDLCVSRSASRARGWGLPVPGDESEVIWVWFDALAYYLSALGYGSADDTRFEQLWRSSSRRIHVIGKGVSRFHAIVWPAILESAGLPWPTDLLVHGYLTLDGTKISKSGRSLDPFPLIDELGSDAVRYYLLRHVRTTRDGDFSHERFVRAYDSELANGVGNLADRVLGLVQRSHGGTVPPAVGACTAEDGALRDAALGLPAKVDRAVERFALDEALAAIFEIVDHANRHVDRSAPWALVRDGDLTRANAVLRTLLETLRVLAAELAPFLPRTAARLGDALAGSRAHDPCAWNVLTEGAPLQPALKLFPRFG